MNSTDDVTDADVVESGNQFDATSSAARAQQDQANSRIVCGRREK